MNCVLLINKLCCYTITSGRLSTQAPTYYNISRPILRMTFNLQFSSLPITRFIKVLEKKGKGSYGAVFYVELDGDTNPQKKKLVCKCLHDILIGRDQELEVSQEERKFMVSKFMKECVLLSNLKHRNIVQFKSVYVGAEGIEFGDISLVMEALEFDLFSACVRSQMKISYIRKLAILRDISSGLKYLHDATIIHRDLNAGIPLSHVQ